MFRGRPRGLCRILQILSSASGFVNILLLSLSAPSPVQSVQIISSSGPDVVVKEGEALDLFCESSSPYQWCYWAHNSTQPPYQSREFPTTAHQGGGEVREATVWGFQWRKSSTRCGLHVAEAKANVGGRWKCHLAHTDAAEVSQIRDERWSTVLVAHPAKPVLSLPTAAVQQGALETVWGGEVAVGCSAPGGLPQASVALTLEKETDKADLGHGTRAQVSYYPTLRETGAVFVCRWQQLAKTGELLYSGEERAPPLLVLLPPEVLPEVATSLVWRPGLTISAPIRARPKPQVQWLLVTQNGSSIPLEETPVEQAEFKYEFGSLEVTRREGEEWGWDAQLEVVSLKEATTILLLAENRVGAKEIHFTLEMPPAPQPRSSQDQEVANPGLLHAGSVAGLGGGLGFALLLLLLSVFICRQRKAGTEQLKTGEELERATPLLGGGQTSHQPFVLPSPSPAPCSCDRPTGLSMATFGKLPLPSSSLCPAHPPPRSAPCPV